MIVGSSAIAISSVGALSLFRFLEKSIKAQPDSKLIMKTSHAKIKEKSYDVVEPWGWISGMKCFWNSIDERSTCITTMTQAPVKKKEKLFFISYIPSGDEKKKLILETEKIKKKKKFLLIWFIFYERNIL